MLNIYLTTELFPGKFLNDRTVSEAAMALCDSCGVRRGREILAEGKDLMQCTPYWPVRLRK